MGGDNMSLSVTILLTGFAVVFAVLLILIGVIKLYGTVIYNIQTKNKQAAKQKIAIEREPAPAVAPVVFPVEDRVEDDGELIAVISAAVYSVMDPQKVRIRSIRRSEPRSGSAWRSAGLADNLRPF